jgi:glycosyltransferase involved in cell wall biosynthesis
VGHLTATKRPDLFIDVIALLRERGCQVTAAIAGDGPLASSLARPAAAAGVDLVGRLADVGSFLASSDVFVFPSLAEGEGMPGVLIEAGLAALPVVATDVPGVRDVVSDRVTGRVVGVDDVAALTDATEELVRNPPLRAAMGASARDRCQRLFSLDVCTGRWVEELRALVGARGT